MEELTITESAEKYLDELLESQEKDTVIETQMLIRTNSA